MPFQEFIGNRKVVERLRAKLREGRFPHALIFSGPDGVGKRTCALMIARALNCTNSPVDDFCGVCSHCRRIEAGTHPDVLHIGVEEDASEIKIAQIRDLLKTLNLHPLEGAAKVFIVDPANKMKPAAANALLKGLEEPPDDSLFILLTNNLQELLLTVRSRSQNYHFTPLALEEMQRFSNNELALRWARGSIGTLKALDTESLQKRRELLLNFLETASAASASEFGDVISASADVARSKTDFESHLSMMAVLLGDLLYLSEQLPDRIVNVDVRARLEKLAAGISPAQFIRIAEFLGTMEISNKGYINRQMLTDVLALSTSQTLEKLASDNGGKSR